MQHVWIFQLKNGLAQAAVEAINRDLQVLMAEWKAHGTPVPGQASVRHDRFIVVQATPGATSGCSIDSMTHGVEAILEKQKVEVLPPNFIYFRNAANQLDYVDFREIKSLIESGDLLPNSVIYDSSMGQSNDLSKWEVKLSDSWLSRYLPASSKA